MYRVIPSRRNSGFSGLFGARGIGSIYSVYQLPSTSCNTIASRDRARQMCALARSNGDSFKPSYGAANNKFPNAPWNPYVLQSSQLWSGVSSQFDPCAAQDIAICPPKNPPKNLPPNVKTPWNCPECFGEPVTPKTPTVQDVPIYNPPAPPAPPAPEDPVVVVQDVPIYSPQPPRLPPPVMPEEPVEVFQEPVPPVEVVTFVEEEESPEKDNTQSYVIGGIVALVVGGGLAYYFVTRKKKRK